MTQGANLRPPHTAAADFNDSTNDAGTEAASASTSLCMPTTPAQKPTVPAAAAASAVAVHRRLVHRLSPALRAVRTVWTMQQQKGNQQHGRGWQRLPGGWLLR